MQHGEGTYIANWFAQSWAITQQLKEQEDAIPKLPPSTQEERDAGMKGGAAYPLGEFKDDPGYEERRLRGKLISD